MNSIEEDLAEYCNAMAQPNGWETCLRIERRYGLDGYPPQVVTTWMSAAAADGARAGDKAVDDLLGTGRDEQ